MKPSTTLMLIIKLQQKRTKDKGKKKYQQKPIQKLKNENHNISSIQFSRSV